MITARITWSELNDWGSYHTYEDVMDFYDYEDLQNTIDRWYEIGCEGIYYEILGEYPDEEE